MDPRGEHGANLTELDGMVERILAGARGDDQQQRAFLRAFEDHVILPADGYVIGVPVSVTSIDCSGSVRRGLTAAVRLEDGPAYEVSVCDVSFPEGSPGARHVAAYRRWTGIDPRPAAAIMPGKTRPKATSADLASEDRVELVLLSVKDRAFRCRLADSERTVTLRASKAALAVPGEILTVRPRKQWRYAGHPYLSGEIESIRLDVEALGLAPLRLEDHGPWDPAEEYWGEPGEPLADWAKAIVERGPRPQFEFEMDQTSAGTGDDALANA